MKTVVTVKTDKKIKEEAQKVAKNMGFSLGTLLNAYMRQLIKNKTVYFTSEPTYYMSEQLEKDLEIIEKDIQEGKNLSPKFDNIDDAINYLDN